MNDRLDRTDVIQRLRAARPAILPSLLLCDFGDLRREVAAVEAAGVPALHLDVMDGHFVPNISYGLPIVEAVRQSTRLPIDVHLMISEPARYIEQFQQAGADSMTIHAEAVSDPRPVLDKIHALGAIAGLAINPPTPLSAIESSLPHCDLVLVMSVMPGFGGQKFDAVALDKLRTLRDRDDVHPLLEVDGGVSDDTIGACAAAGAELFVTGSAIFRTNDYAAAVCGLRDAAEIVNSQPTRNL
ncbi:MAG TPA: ribulose-phosphate 3-epimerase [Lacipirellulaceae bacterium]|jgi:ribulose-phosphate 3-epimerase